MAKNHRVEVRLNDDEYDLLREQAAFYGTSLTAAVERLLHIPFPVAAVGVREVGVRGRRRVNIRFSNGMVVHGFLWSRRGQLLAPAVRGDYGYVRIVNGSPEFWRTLRQFCARELGVDNDGRGALVADAEAELAIGL